MDLRSFALSTPRLRLAAFRPEDAAEIFAAVTPAVTRFMSFDPSPSLEAFAAVWPRWLDQMAAGLELFPVLRLAESGEFVGVSGLHGLDRAEPDAGLWLRESAQGRGLGPEAVAALIGWAADTCGVRAVLWPVVEANLRSRRLAERLGGVVVGTRRLRKGAFELPEIVYRIPARAGVAGGR